MINKEFFKNRGMFYLVPIFMSLIFLLQLGLSHIGNLSPWKGGGFGMFSSIDSPGMRVVHCEGVDTEGKPVQIRIRFTGLGEKGPLTRQLGKLLTTFPTQGQLKEVGELLLDGEFVPYDTPSKIPDEFVNTFQEQRFYRLKYPYEEAEEVIRLQSVKVSLLKIRYSQDEHQIYYEPLIPAISLHQNTPDHELPHQNKGRTVTNRQD
jgi:hypothetical protein